MISRFWDYCSSRPNAATEYFSAQHSREVVEFLRFVRPLEGCETLDYGCGPGYLVEALLDAGARVTGVDFSVDSITQTEERFSGKSGWVEARAMDGSTVPYEDESFDLICCLETIEHVLDDQLQSLLTEIHRLLRPRAIALLTTPNSEELHRSAVYCPQCDHEFHRWQHVRNWTPQKLEEVLDQHGFNVKMCRGLNFPSFRKKRRSLMDWSARTVYSDSRRFIDRLLDKLAPQPFPQGRYLDRLIKSHRSPHLAAVVQRP